MLGLYMRGLFGFLFIISVLAAPLFAAADGNVELQVRASKSISRLNREGAEDPASALLISELLQRELGLRDDELKWSGERSIGWGEVAVLAYIEATTGKSFASIDDAGARRNLWAYAENAGMSFDKMARWLVGFRERAERERNTQIFDSLRASRRVSAMPDVGSGFGLVQDSIDFRNIDSSRPNKVHDLPGGSAKGEK